MCRPGIKKRAQVILELVMVFICLAFLAYFSVKAFSNFNLNMVERVNLFKNSRKLAVNAPVNFNYGPINGLGQVVPIWSVFSNEPRPPEGMGQLSNPLTYLDYGPYAKILGDAGSGRVINNPGSAGNVLPYLEDERLIQAGLLLEKKDLIINVILPYKVNQAYSLGKAARFNNSWGYFEECLRHCQDQGGQSCYDKCINEAWTPLGYISTAKQLCQDSIALAKSAYKDDFLGAIDLFQEVLDKPVRPGPFEVIKDPPDEEQLGKYGLRKPQPGEPNYDQRLAAYNAAVDDLKRQHDANRENLQGAVNGLNNSKNGLDIFLNGTGLPAGNPTKAVIPYLEYVRDNLGGVENYGWWAAWRHQDALRKLKETIDFVAEIYPASPTSPKKLPAALVALTEKVHKKLDEDLIKKLEKNQITSKQAKEIAQEAKTDAAAIPGILESLKQADYPFLYQVGLDGRTIIENLKNVATDLNSNLDSVITKWDTLDENERLEYLMKARNNALILKAGCANPPTGGGGIDSFILGDALAAKIMQAHDLLKPDISIIYQDAYRPNIEKAARISSLISKDPGLNTQILKDLAGWLKDDLGNSLGVWNKVDKVIIDGRGVTLYPRKAYLQFCRVYSWAFYRVTDVNRLLLVAKLRQIYGVLNKELDWIAYGEVSAALDLVKDLAKNGLISGNSSLKSLPEQLRKDLEDALKYWMRWGGGNQERKHYKYLRSAKEHALALYNAINATVSSTGR